MTAENSRQAGDDLTRSGGDLTSTPTGEVGAPDQPEWTPGRTWSLQMPAGQELLTSNQRLNRYKQARIVKQLRSDAYYLAKYAKVPHLQRAHVVCVYQPPPTRGVKDVGNLAPSAKALVDGAICDAKVLPDDSDAYMTGPDMRRSTQTHPGGRLLLVITELTTKDPS